MKTSTGFISTAKTSMPTEPFRFKASRQTLIRACLKKVFFFFLRRDARIVMCVPRGGLNDMLCQIHHCSQYARAHHRILIVNTIKSGFRDTFSNYFETWIPDPMLCLNAESILRHKTGNEDCFPLELNGRAYSYVSAYSDLLNFYELETGIPIRFNPAHDYSQKLLIHEQCGGGSEGWRALENLRLTKEMRTAVMAKIANLPPSYVGIHVRHSDVTTNYVKFFDLISADVRHKVVLVCSDSHQVLSHAKQVLPAREIMTLSDIPDNGGMPLHDYPSLTTKKTNIDLLVDLFSLALASKIVTPSPDIGYPSGFAELARQLMLRPSLICQLLGSIPKQLNDKIDTTEIQPQG